MIKNLIVCGDSFQDFGHSPKYDGTHWSEIVADRLGLNLVNLAIKGGSSVAVAFQMLHAEKVPNSIVVGSLAATESRFEITTSSDTSIQSTIENFVYKPNKNDPWQDKNSRFQYIHTKPLNDIPPILRDQILMHFDLKLKYQTDIWTVMYALGRLRYQEIPVLFIQSIAKSNPIPLEYFKPFLNDDCIIKHEDFNFFSDIYDHDKMTLEEIYKVDPGYHTTLERQIVIADYMTARLSKVIT